MDEPTSALDARVAAIIMLAVRNTMDTGRMVVRTIHQPSVETFKALDELLLMKRGSKIIYAIPGIPKMRDGHNLATWILEVTFVAIMHQLGINFTEIYRELSFCRENIQLVKQLSISVSATKDLYFPTPYAQNP
ncbi:hypothetical protein SUGI_0687630 [Cryptomeria japonica]|nr:hypothetical protein SUGI_0687630 [Cryptomeria japonica]